MCLTLNGLFALQCYEKSREAHFLVPYTADYVTNSVLRALAIQILKLEKISEL